MIVGLAVGITWYLSRCNTQHYIKFHIKWWFNHDFDRWLGKRIDACEKWNSNMTKVKWFIMGVIIFSFVFIPVIVWNFTIPESERSVYSEYMIPILFIEYFALIGVMAHSLFKKKSKEIQSHRKVQHE